jgi:hypothetical protein
MPDSDAMGPSSIAMSPRQAEYRTPKICHDVLKRQPIGLPELAGIRGGE